VQDHLCSMVRRTRRFSVRASLAALVVSAAAGLPAHGQTRPTGLLVSGVAYDLRVTSTPTAGLGMAAAMGATAQDYIGHAVFVGRRGRLDIVEGGVASLLNKGDYVLFDSSAITVVRPATQEYIPISAEMASDAFAQLQALGVQITLGDVKVTLDSLRGTDTVAGHPTRHFRMTTAFTMSLDAAIVQQRFAAESITEYWVASVPGLPADALLRVNSLTTAPLTGVFKELASKVDSAAALMGSGAALKSKTVSRFIQGPGSSVTTEQTSEVSNVRRVQVPEAQLSVPTGYHKGSIGSEIPKSGRSPGKHV